MKNKYVSYEVRYSSEIPTENGKYFGKTPIFEQALTAAKKIKGSLYGILPNGEAVWILY